MLFRKSSAVIEQLNKDVSDLNTQLFEVRCEVALIKDALEQYSSALTDMYDKEAEVHKKPTMFMNGIKASKDAYNEYLAKYVGD